MDFGGVINGVALGLMAMNDARFREVKLVITNRHRELELRGMRHILLNGRCSRAPYATVPADEGGATSHYGNNERVATFCTDLTAFRTRGCVVYKLTRKGGRPLPDGRLFVIIGWDVPLRGANQYFLELVKADFPTFPDDREELQRQYLHLALSNSKCGADEVLQRHLRLQDGISLVVAATMGTASVTDLRLELYEDHADDGARHRPVQLAPLNIMSNGHDSPSLAMPNAGPLAVTASAASTGTIGTASTGTMVVSSINGHRPSVSIAPPMLANDTTSNVVPSSVRLRRKIQIELRNQHSDILLCESQHDVAKGGCQQAPDAQIRPGNASSAEFRTAVYGAGRGWIVYQLTRAKDRVWQRRIFMAIAWDVPHTGVGRFHMTVFQADHKEFPQDHNERDRIFTLMWKEMMQRGHGQRVWTGELMPGIRFTLSTNVSGGSTARFMVNLTHEHEDRSMLTPIWLPAYTCFTYRTNFAAVQVQKLLAAAAGQQRNSLGYTGSFAMFVLVENAHPSTLLCLCSIDSRSRSVRKEGSAGVLRSGIHDILSAHVGESERSLMGHAVYQVAENLVLPSSSNLPTEGRASTSLGGGAGGEQRLYILVSWTAPTITQIRYGVEFFSAYDDEPLANSSATRSLFFVLAALSRGYRGHRVTRMASFKGESRALLVQGYLSMDDNPVLSVYFGPVSDTTAAVQRRTTFGGVAQGRMPTQVQFTLENLHPSVRLQSGRFYSVSSHILEDFDRALLPHGRAAGLIAADPSATASSGVVMYQIVDLEGKPLDNLPYLIIAWRMALENGNEEIRFVADVLQEVEFGERDPAGDAMLSLPNLYNVLMRSKDADASRGSYAVEDERVGFLSRRKNRSLYSVTLDSNVAKARNTLNAIICFSNESQGGRHASDNLSISSEETVAPSIAPDDDMDHPLSPPPVPALPSAHPNPIYWHPPRSTSLPAHKQLQPQPQPQPIVRPHTLATMVLDVHNLHAGIRLLYPHAYIVQGEPATIPSGTLGLGDQLSCEFTSTANGSGLAEGFIMAAVEDRERQLTTSTYLTIGWHVAPTGERAYFANAVQVTFDMHERFATHAGRDKFFRRLADTRMISAGGHVRQRIKVDGLNVALIGRLSRETEPGPPYLRMRLVDPNDPTLMRQRSGSLTSSGTNATSDSQSTVQPAVVEQYHSQFPPEDRAINFEPNPSMRARAPSSRVLPLSDTNSERSVPSMRNSVAIMPGVTTIEEYGSSSAREAAALKRQTLSGEVKYARMKSRPLPQPPSRDNSASNLSMLSTSMANASIGAPKPQETTGKADESSLAVNEASSNNGSSSSSGGSITAHRASQIMPIEAKEQLKLIFAIRNLLADISLQLVACQAVEGMCTRSLQEQVDARSRNEDWGTFASSTHLYDAATNEAIVQLEGIIAYRIGYTDGTPLARPVLLLIGWNMSQKAPNRLLLEIVALNSMQQLPNATDHRAWHDILQGLDAMSRFSCYGAVDMEIAIDDRRQIEIQASLTSGANAKLRIKLKELLLDEAPAIQ
ncbi:hypothetical protein SYNPS1DRAFT_29289 [Syncephalis pseudoplumigaleata]|uniref:Uncharacterized protein n=1 Tax=Syncephalis pseudoplumigaleata TaxID=1712513 RepID=A0A4P9YY13_9FUNG|nr:hypothetical protein SYNPS1DRAFT_29289 [Syncephalis pseudoplumigaleata]|eukprot:RKP24967.1 hypothetical protein SYNPS1DRAFT_29289 [Syncephalis pseudoplumigaleata]